MRSESREPGRPKVCSKCKIKKEATEYHLHKGLLRSRCKACSNRDAAGSASRRAYLYAWQAANPGKVAEAQRRYREINREALLLSNRQWHAKNKDVARAIASAKRARKRGAAAQWDVELTDFVGRECAALAQMREAATGFAVARRPYSADLRARGVRAARVEQPTRHPGHLQHRQEQPLRRSVRWEVLVVTCIAWDGRTLAADKRAEDGIIWGTTTKIHRVGDALVGFSGTAFVAVEMLAWYRDGAKPADFPASARDKERNADLLVVTAQRKVMVYQGGPHPVAFDDARHAIGIGRDAAMAAMVLGCDARRAVEVASEVCVGCGNGVDALEFVEP